MLSIKLPLSLIIITLVLGGCRDSNGLTSKDHDAINNNLRQICSAASGYMLEEGHHEVRYAYLEGSYFHTIQSIAGENYEDLVIREGIKSISVTTSAGQTVTFDLTTAGGKISGMANHWKEL